MNNSRYVLKCYSVLIKKLIYDLQYPLKKNYKTSYNYQEVRLHESFLHLKFPKYFPDKYDIPSKYFLLNTTIFRKYIPYLKIENIYIY